MAAHHLCGNIRIILCARLVAQQTYHAHRSLRQFGRRLDEAGERSAIEDIQRMQRHQDIIA